MRQFILDIVMMDKDELIIKLEVSGCLGTHDHDLIIFNIGKESTAPTNAIYP